MSEWLRAQRNPLPLVGSALPSGMGGSSYGAGSSPFYSTVGGDS